MCLPWEGGLSSVLPLRPKMTTLPLIWRSTWARWTGRLRKTSPGTALLPQIGSVESHLRGHDAHLCTSPPRQGLADYLEGYHNQVNICLQKEVAGTSPEPSSQLRRLLLGVSLDDRAETIHPIIPGIQFLKSLDENDLCGGFVHSVLSISFIRQITKVVACCSPGDRERL